MFIVAHLLLAPIIVCSADGAASSAMLNPRLSRIRLHMFLKNITTVLSSSLISLSVILHHLTSDSVVARMISADALNISRHLFIFCI